MNGCLYVLQHIVRLYEMKTSQSSHLEKSGDESNTYAYFVVYFMFTSFVVALFGLSYERRSSLQS